MSLKAKNILLIGGAGYVGTVITSHFLKRGYKVTVFDNFIYNHFFSVTPYLGDPDYRLVKGDINDNLLLENAMEGITDVIVLAGLVGDPITKTYPEESYVINEAGIRNCFRIANGRRISKLIFISTCSNYGMIGEKELADEDFQLSPLSLYARAKVNNELCLLDLKDKVDYAGVILRFATAFGVSPRMRFDLSVSEFVRDLYFGEELLVYDEHTWRPYCHVRDFARLLETVVESESEKVYFQVFNAGGDKNNFTKKMIVDDILKIIPNGKVRYGRTGSDPRNYRVSFSKVKSILGFEPNYSVSDGISELTEALKAGLYSDSMTDKNKYGNFLIEKRNIHV
jgi:nucleoside-diphosphate-sugar epimerase